MATGISAFTDALALAHLLFGLLRFPNSPPSFAHPLSREPGLGPRNLQEIY